MNLAGWAKKLSGKASITVGSVGLDGDFLDSLTEGAPGAASMGQIRRLLAMLEDGEVDLVAVGRALLADPSWTSKMRDGRADMESFSVARLASLV